MLAAQKIILMAASISERIYILHLKKMIHAMPEKVKLYVTGRLFSGVYFLLPTRDINAANVKIILCVILEEIKV